MRASVAAGLGTDPFTPGVLVGVAPTVGSTLGVALSGTRQFGP